MGNKKPRLWRGGAAKCNDCGGSFYLAGAVCFLFASIATVHAVGLVSVNGSCAAAYWASDLNEVAAACLVGVFIAVVPKAFLGFALLGLAASVGGLFASFATKFLVCAAWLENIVTFGVFASAVVGGHGYHSFLPTIIHPNVTGGGSHKPITVWAGNTVRYNRSVTIAVSNIVLPAVNVML